jgi:hypothetical protein
VRRGQRAAAPAGSILLPINRQFDGRRRDERRQGMNRATFVVGTESAASVNVVTRVLKNAAVLSWRPGAARIDPNILASA